MKRRTATLCAPMLPNRIQTDSPTSLKRKIDASEKIVQKAIEDAYNRASMMSRRMFEAIEKQQF